MVNEISQSIRDITGLSPTLQSNILLTLIILIVSCVIKMILRRMVSKRVEDDRKFYILRIVNTVIVLIEFILIGRIWITGISSLTTFIGLIIAGLVISLSDIFKNIIGYFYIKMNNTFNVKDRIMIKDVKGNVLKINMFTFMISDLNGSFIHVPNSHIFNYEIKNLTQGFNFVWNILPVLITFESNWKKCENILLEIAHNHELSILNDDKKEIAMREVKEVKAEIHINITEEDLVPEVYVSAEDSGIMLKLRYPVKDMDLFVSKNLIWREILTAFEEHDDIDLAYPTMRIVK